MSLETNSITLIGIVRDDPEVKEIDGVGTVAKFRIGVYRSGTKKNSNVQYDDFFVSAWHDLARGIGVDIQKDDWVIVFGSYLVNAKKNDDGSWTHYHTISASAVGKQVRKIEKEDGGEAGEEDPF